MPTIEIAKRLIKRMVLLNLATPKGLAITPLLSGPHGIGKSQIVIKAARELNGNALIVEGGSLKEGEITGLPLAFETEDHAKEVRFVPYYLIANIKKLEKYYYEKVIKEGFLNGLIHLDKEGLHIKNGQEKTIIPPPNTIEVTLRGEDNRYKWGDQLPYEIKLELFQKNEIKPIILFIDELNRTDPQVMRELMNIILNRNINGYDLPWWVTIVAAVNPSTQGSIYAVNELDEAQLDRFLKISLDADADEWIDYALNQALDEDVIYTISDLHKLGLFVNRSKAHEDQDNMTPSPRSWEMIAYLIHFNELFNQTNFFTDAEKNQLDHDNEILIRGKVGSSAGRVFLQNFESDKNQKLFPKEILNGNSSKLNPGIVLKFKGFKKIRQKIVADSVAKYLGENIIYIEQSGKKDEYNNIEFQLKEFVALLDPSTMLSFVKATLKVPLKGEHKSKVFSKFSKLFAADVIRQITAVEDNLTQLKQ
jgi:MoxR-like ATPase